MINLIIGYTLLALFGIPAVLALFGACIQGSRTLGEGIRNLLLRSLIICGAILALSLAQLVVYWVLARLGFSL